MHSAVHADICLSDRSLDSVEMDGERIDLVFGTEATIVYPTVC